MRGMGQRPIVPPTLHSNKEKAMASLSLKHIYKVYDGTTRAVNDFNMEIGDREFIVFVGPSGCGKSTTLRMIAGLEDISAGELRIDDVVVNDMEPRDRNIAMVFQNYALYPHMTVYENMAFALKTARVPKAEIHEKVTEAARILGITEYLERKPRALSGGQRQRVALGRAIVRHPKVFLFDEPLSNLDAKLRAAMRAEIIRLYERLGTTFIYVTHDQVEAMTMGSRIVVMRGGVVQQIDTPMGLYNHPENLFVAGFIGTPRMNFWDGTLLREGDTVHASLASGVTFDIPYACLYRVRTRYMDGRHPLVLGIRPDHLRLWEEGLDTATWVKIPATADVVEVLGGESLIYGRMGADTGTLNEETVTESDGTGREVILKIPADALSSDHAGGVKRGDALAVAVNVTRLQVFDKATEVTLNRRMVRENVCPCRIDGDSISFAGQRFSLPSALSDPLRVLKGKAPLDGEVCLPCEAILLGTGAGRARVAEVECFPPVGGDPALTDRKHILYRLDIGGEVFFASETASETASAATFETASETASAETTDNERPRFAVGDSVPFDVDFARITVTSQGRTDGSPTASPTASPSASPLIRPLPQENELDGRLTKVKMLDDRPDSPTRGRRVHRFFVEVSDHPLEAEPALCEKLFSCKGSDIFRIPLLYRFPVSGVRILPRAGSGAGIDGRVTALLDYGRVTYARISVGTREVIAPYSGEVGEAVRLCLDQSRLTVLDKESGIILA